MCEFEEKNCWEESRVERGTKSSPQRPPSKTLNCFLAASPGTQESQRWACSFVCGQANVLFAPSAAATMWEFSERGFQGPTFAAVIPAKAGIQDLPASEGIHPAFRAGLDPVFQRSDKTKEFFPWNIRFQKDCLPNHGRRSINKLSLMETWMPIYFQTGRQENGY